MRSARRTRSPRSGSVGIGPERSEDDARLDRSAGSCGPGQRHADQRRRARLDHLHRHAGVGPAPAEGTPRLEPRLLDSHAAERLRPPSARRADSSARPPIAGRSRRPAGRAYSITWERWNASSLMRLTTARSTSSPIAALDSARSKREKRRRGWMESRALHAASHLADRAGSCQKARGARRRDARRPLECRSHVEVRVVVSSRCSSARTCARAQTPTPTPTPRRRGSSSTAGASRSGSPSRRAPPSPPPLRPPCSIASASSARRRTTPPSWCGAWPASHLLGSGALGRHLARTDARRRRQLHAGPARRHPAQRRHRRAGRRLRSLDARRRRHRQRRGPARPALALLRIERGRGRDQPGYARRRQPGPMDRCASTPARTRCCTPARRSRGRSGPPAVNRHSARTTRRESDAREGAGFFLGAQFDRERHAVADDSYEQLTVHGAAAFDVGAAAALRVTGRAAELDIEDYPEGSGGPVFGSGELRAHRGRAAIARPRLGRPRRRLAPPRLCDGEPVTAGRRVAGDRVLGAGLGRGSRLHPRPALLDRRSRLSRTGRHLTRRAARSRARREREHAVSSTLPRRRHHRRLPALAHHARRVRRGHRSTPARWWSRPACAPTIRSRSRSSGVRAWAFALGDRGLRLAACAAPGAAPSSCRASSRWRARPRSAATRRSCPRPASAPTPGVEYVRGDRSPSASRSSAAPTTTSSTSTSRASSTSIDRVSKPRGSSSAARLRPVESLLLFAGVDAPGRRERDRANVALHSPDHFGNLGLEWSPLEPLLLRIAGARRRRHRGRPDPGARSNRRSTARRCSIWRRAGALSDAFILRARLDNATDEEYEQFVGFPQPGRRARIGVEYGFR